MLTLKQINQIRNMFYIEGKEITEISKRTHISYNTVKKYIDKEDFNTPPPKNKQDSQSITPSLDPWKEMIRDALEKDKKHWRKQRFTAKNIYECLKKYGTLTRSEQKAIARGEIADPPPKYTGSYRTISSYVSALKKELRIRQGTKGLPLSHWPGEAQADFGEADVLENKVKRRVIYFVLSFSYSNACFFQIKHSKNMEALLESLKTIFEYIGGVPEEIWFDNDNVIVRSILDSKERVTYERFQRFQMHYRFKAIFMNRGKGNEKGNVENKIRYVRINSMVPMPEFVSIEDQNQEFLREAWEDGNRPHYRHDETIQKLFEEDREALLPLPTTPFDTTGVIERLKTDRSGRFRLGKDKCLEYSTSLDCANAYVSLRLTSDTVTVLDAEGKVVVVHERLSGESKQSKMDWGPYLKDVARRPRSYKNTIRPLLPSELTQHLDKCGESELAQVLESLARLYEQKGFEAAVREVVSAMPEHSHDPDRLNALHRSLFSDLPRFTDENVMKASESPDLPKTGSALDDLAMFDKLLKYTGGLNV